MADFDWQQAYSIGNDLIDREHQHLLVLANKVVEFRPSGERVENVREAILALCEYVKTHFANEEAYMQQVGFPKLTAHKVLHEAIIHEVNTILKESPGLDSLVYKLKRLMKNWVIEHIKQADSQIGDFLRSQPTGSQSPDPPPEEEHD